MIDKFLNSLGIQLPAQRRAIERTARTNDFIDNLLLPDMAVRGFGFGRVAVAEALRRRGFVTFGQLDGIDGAFLAELENERGVGRKVIRAFANYLERRTGIQPLFDGSSAKPQTPDAPLRNNALDTTTSDDAA